MKAYLDIETCAGGQVTVVGIYREDRGLRQLVGSEITDVRLWDALDGVDVLCTFNGDSFDLPVLARQLRVDLRPSIRSLDLLRECRGRGIKGGLKRLEERFGIGRATRGMNGWDAVRLWARYEQEGDRDALQRLLEYNREDVMNLIALERIVVGVGLELEAEQAAPPRPRARQEKLFQFEAGDAPALEQRVEPVECAPRGDPATSPSELREEAKSEILPRLTVGGGAEGARPPEPQSTDSPCVVDGPAPKADG